MIELAYAFRHAMVCDAAYQLQPPTDRAALHLLALRARRDATPVELARHALGARQAVSPRQAGILERLAARWIFRGMQTARSHNDPGLVLRLYEELQILEHASHRIVIQAMQLAIACLRLLGRSGEARALLDEAIGYAQQHRLTRWDDVLLLARTELAADTGDLKGATVAMQDAVDRARRDGRKTLELQALGNLGVLLDMAGRTEDALAAYFAAQQLVTRAENPGAYHTLVGNIGIALVAAGRTTEARASLREATDLAKELEDDVRLCFWLGWMGTLEMMEGNHDAARDHLAQGIALAQRVGFRMGEAAWTAEVAKLDASVGRTDEARRGFEYAIEIATEAAAVQQSASWRKQLEALPT